VELPRSSVNNCTAAPNQTKKPPSKTAVSVGKTALAWGPKVTAAKDMSLTPEEAEQRWREQLRIEAKRRADNYAAAASEY